MGARLLALPQVRGSNAPEAPRSWESSAALKSSPPGCRTPPPLPMRSSHNSGPATLPRISRTASPCFEVRRVCFGIVPKLNEIQESSRALPGIHCRLPFREDRAPKKAKRAESRTQPSFVKGIKPPTPSLSEGGLDGGDKVFVGGINFGGEATDEFTVFADEKFLEVPADVALLVGVAGAGEVG